MTTIALLREESEMAFGGLLTALDGVTEKQAWAVLPNNGPDYLHSDASIHGITLHIATCKVMYASIAFHNSEVRWRDCAERLEAFEPSWGPAMEYLREAQDYWTKSWSAMAEGDLENEVRHLTGRTMPAWKSIRTVIDHDSYHAGQIAMLRYGCPETGEGPPSVAEDIRKYCRELPDW